MVIDTRVEDEKLQFTSEKSPVIQIYFLFKISATESSDLPDYIVHVLRSLHQHPGLWSRSVGLFELEYWIQTIQLSEFKTFNSCGASRPYTAAMCHVMSYHQFAAMKLQDLLYS